MTTYNLDSTSIHFYPKDFWSATTHAVGFVLALNAMPVLLIKASVYGAGMRELTAYAVFMLSMTLLYGASAAYHSFNVNERVNKVLKIVDHSSIFVLIAGSYMPVCICGLASQKAMMLLAFIWLFALSGIAFKILWVTCPRWVSSLIYTCMGWACVMVIPDMLKSLPRPAFAWLLAGGLFYTVGALIYARKKDLTGIKGFGNHEIFHLFVLAGSICHFIQAFCFLCV